MAQLRNIQLNKLNNNTLLLSFQVIETDGSNLGAEIVHRLLPHDAHAKLPEPIQFDPTRWYGIGDYSLAVRMQSMESPVLEVRHNGEYAPLEKAEAAAFLSLPEFLEQKQLIDAAGRAELEQFVRNALSGMTMAG